MISSAPPSKTPAAAPSVPPSLRRPAPGLHRARGWFLLACALPAFAFAQESRPPRPIHQVSPSIPGGLSPGDLPGTADIQLVIDEKGAIVEAKVTEASHPALGEAALAAAKQWRFEPGMIRGRPVARTVSVPFMFRSPEGPALPEVAGRQIFVELRETPVFAETLPSMPVPLRQAWPRYPAQLEGTGAKGAVTIAIVIDRNGDVINPEIVSSDNPAFNTPAVASALAQRYAPVRNLKGEPLLVSLLVRYEFHPSMLQEEERERRRRIVLPAGSNAVTPRPATQRPLPLPAQPRMPRTVRPTPTP